MKFITISNILLSVLSVNSSPPTPKIEDSRSFRHFWLQNVCGIKGMNSRSMKQLGSKSSITGTSTFELMSKAITSDCIRTYGMLQSDKKNNSVNRLQATTRRRKRSKTSTTLSNFAEPQNQEEIQIANPFPNPSVQILSPPITRV